MLYSFYYITNAFFQSKYDLTYLLLQKAVSEQFPDRIVPQWTYLRRTYPRQGSSPTRELPHQAVPQPGISPTGY